MPKEEGLPGERQERNGPRRCTAGDEAISGNADTATMK
jgi:hypothetical protein